MVIVLVILGCCQLVQWVFAFASLYVDDFLSKSEFLIALIPGMFIFYSLKMIKSAIDNFIELDWK